ncbi:MAG TPA: CpsD/CapB family tyrosine-protein kinase [Firmicutes bacterium]|nr:CpsD/CapB family tyrosine-protein kinase [Bacillota bacterium]
MLIVHHQPKSPVAEAYRTLRTNIQFAAVGHALRTLLITSAGPDEGKTTALANLGVAMAQAGSKVLLVNADLRRPALHRLLNRPERVGLTNVLLGTVPLEEAIQPTGIENLSFLGSGPLPPNPSELLGSAAMGEIIARLQEMYDLALFDAPPVVAITDAAVLAPRVDGVILLVRSGHTDREAARQARLNLQRVGARILGVILNDVQMRGGRYGYYYYYYYRHAAGSDARSEAAASVDTPRDEDPSHVTSQPSRSPRRGE